MNRRPSGNPTEDLRDHIYPLKVKYKEVLEDVLAKLKTANEELHTAAAVNHAEILYIQKRNEECHEHFNHVSISESKMKLAMYATQDKTKKKFSTHIDIFLSLTRCDIFSIYK